MDNHTATGHDTQIDSTPKDAIIMRLAQTLLPALDGVPISQLHPVRVVRSYSDGIPPYEQHRHVVAFAGHPEYGDGEEEILGYVTQHSGQVSACWGWSGTDVNGVTYGSRTEANRVRRALAAAGIPQMSVSHPRARKVLKAAGL